MDSLCKSASIIVSANPEWQIGHPGLFSRAGKLFERQRVLAGPGKFPGVAETVIMARKSIPHIPITREATDAQERTERHS